MGNNSKYEILNELLISKGVVIGDRWGDIKAVKENNLILVFCSYGYGSTEEGTKADYVITDLSELNMLIEEI
ncbi:MAG: hypothetical protein ACFFC6_08165 [Promethearchaeota archaeon]